jgi:hypothetical protein
MPARCFLSIEKREAEEGRRALNASLGMDGIQLDGVAVSSWLAKVLSHTFEAMLAPPRNECKWIILRNALGV